MIDNINWVNSSIVFSYNKGPYETLKSIGLDKIKSDTLRYTLTNHYDVILPRFTSFFEIAHKRHEPKINELLEVLEKKEFFKRGFELSKKREGFYPKTDHDVNKYLNEDIYYNLLVLQASYKAELWTDIKSIIRLTEETKKAVELEIEERFKRYDSIDRKVLDSISIQCRSYSLNDSIWIKLSEAVNKIPVINLENRNQLLKKSNFIQLKDSLGVYLMRIQDVLERNDLAPLEYVKPTIDQIVINKRKLEIIKQLEKDITKDAIKNEQFEVYK